MTVDRLINTPKGELIMVINPANGPYLKKGISGIYGFYKEMTTIEDPLGFETRVIKIEHGKRILPNFHGWEESKEPNRIYLRRGSEILIGIEEILNRIPESYKTEIKAWNSKYGCLIPLPFPSRISHPRQ